MNKTVWKIFISFTALSVIISMILLVSNVLGILYLGNDTRDFYSGTPKKTLEKIGENLTFTQETIRLSDEMILSEDEWCILISENGDVIWSQNKPDDVPDHYEINDIAKMTRWYLNDYPVYMRTEDYGLLVLGIPKNTVAKYNIQYSMEWFHTLPQRALLFLILNLIQAVLLALLFGAQLYRHLRVLTAGIRNLRLEKRVRLKEKGIFKELSRNINETSESIERKNAMLRSRDHARSNWIAGISHDIRTSLSMIMGYSETLTAASEISTEHRRQAAVITAQSMKMKKLIEDLNLISSLEYDMQPSRKKVVHLCPLLRNIATEILNNGLDERFELILDLQYEQAVIFGDETLLERAFFNLLNNSISHNPDGCEIRISEYLQNDTVCICLSDNGCGVPDDVIKNISVIPKTAHGLGLPMAYKIFHVHGGKMTVLNHNGFTAKIVLPCAEK